MRAERFAGATIQLARHIQQAFHAEFVSASHGEFAVVGDFDQKEVDEVARELFGAWTSKARYERVPEQTFPTPATTIALETPDKANAFYIAGQAFEMKDSDPDYPALVMADFLIGGGMQSRLIERLRQKDGLSYYAGSQFNAGALDPSARSSRVEASAIAARIAVFCCNNSCLSMIVSLPRGGSDHSSVL